MNHLFDTIAKNKNLNALFIQVPKGKTSTYKSWTYGQAFERSAQIAHLLREKGVRKGDRVAIQAEKTPDMIFTYLACLRVGAGFLPLNTAYTQAEIAYFIGDAEPKLFICDPAREEAYHALNTPLLTLGLKDTGSLSESADKQAKTFTNEICHKDDMAGILYTSGTTGRSKGAVMSHENLASNALTLAKLWQFTPQDTLLHALPIFHTHGLFVATNVTLMAGSSILFFDKFAPDEMLDAMPQATTMMGVPTFYVRLLQNARLDKTITAKMRLFISGSAPLLAETHIEWKNRTGHAILERYGMTETNMITSNPYVGERIAGTVGFPLEGVDVRITDPETGEILPTNTIGMIEVQGANVFKEYWRMIEKTKAEFRQDGYFITGDLGKIDERGYVHILGRGKDLIITGGYNVYPKEIEGEIDEMQGVDESAVIGLPHKDFGEGVTAVVVLKKGAYLSETDILKHLETRLAKFKQPKKIFIVQELPRNTMGKVQKNLLREQYKGLFSTPQN
jgi:malonyl-CoA/methylmalonyl-CoA synthetase